MALNQFQRKHLKERVDAAQRDKIEHLRYGRKEIAPVAVETARERIKSLNKVVKQWERSQEKKAERGVKSVKIRAQHCHQQILFAEADAALHAVEAFERSY